MLRTGIEVRPRRTSGKHRSAAGTAEVSALRSRMHTVQLRLQLQELQHVVFTPPYVMRDELWQPADGGWRMLAAATVRVS